jgi:hypothetical protein
METHRYGENPEARMYNLDGKTVMVDEKFLLATIIGIITALEQLHENISGAISGISETIYEHIKEADFSGLGQTGTDAGEPSEGSESDGAA